MDNIDARQNELPVTTTPFHQIGPADDAARALRIYFAASAVEHGGMAGTDILLTALFAIGLTQLSWFSLMLHLRGVPAQRIVHALPPLAVAWVLLWPVYAWPMSVLLSMLVASLLFALIFRMKHAWARVLRSSWSSPRQPRRAFLFWSGLLIAAALFAALPAAGFGTALSLCLPLPIAGMLDRSRWLPAPAGQSWAGHVVFMLSATAVCLWTASVYSTDTAADLLAPVATATAVAAVARAGLPDAWQPPLLALVLGGMLWLTNP